MLLKSSFRCITVGISNSEDPGTDERSSVSRDVMLVANESSVCCEAILRGHLWHHNGVQSVHMERRPSRGVRRIVGRRTEAKATQVLTRNRNGVDP